MTPSSAAQRPEGDDETKPARVTPRMLRRARRKAANMGIEARDDHEALRILQEMGIDVMAPDNSMLSRLPSLRDREGGGIAEDGEDPANDPLLLPATSRLPGTGRDVSTEVGPAPARSTGAAEIEEIQRGLVARRRRRLAFLFLKLWFFVLLPTLIVGYYYYTQATELYRTQSAFVIQKSEGGQGAGGVGGLLSGTGFATAQDSIIVQDYLLSREALRRLDEDHGFIAHFQQEHLDPIRRLPPDATVEDAYRLYRNHVTVGYDTSEGVLRMDVIAADPASSQLFAEALVGYAEERVDQLSARVRNDQMAGARASYEDAEAQVLASQQRVLDLQQQRGVLSAEMEVTSQMGIINSMEMDLENKRLELGEIMSNPAPNATRVAVTQREIAQLESRISELRGAMTTGTEGMAASLAVISGELRFAEADLATRQLMLQNAAQQLESARVEANRQVRYLSIGVAPVAPDTPTYPRKLENTILAFLIFLSIYLVISLTVSILREQVSV